MIKKKPYYVFFKIDFLTSAKIITPHSLDNYFYSHTYQIWIFLVLINPDHK